MAMTVKNVTLWSTTALATAMLLAGCEPGGSFNREAGAEVDEGRFGNPTMTNMLVHTGRLEATHALRTRFANEVNSTINFAFNSADLSEAARTTLRQQANWIRQFPVFRF